MSDVGLLVLAAGRGSRMREYTVHNPKCLVEFRGRPFLDWQVRASNLAGVNDVHIISGYLHERLPRKFSQTFNDQWATTNSAFSLFLFDSNRWSSTIVSYSDLIYPAEAVECLIDSGSITVLFDINWLDLWSRRFEQVSSDAESFRVDESGRITEIGELGHDPARIQGQFMGLFHLDRQGWSVLKDVYLSLDYIDRRNVDITSLLAHAISRGVTVKGVKYDKPWGEIDSPEDLILYQTDPTFLDLRNAIERMNS